MQESAWIQSRTALRKFGQPTNHRPRRRAQKKTPPRALLAAPGARAPAVRARGLRGGAAVRARRLPGGAPRGAPAVGAHGWREHGRPAFVSQSILRSSYFHSFSYDSLPDINQYQSMHPSDFKKLIARVQKNTTYQCGTNDVSGNGRYNHYVLSHTQSINHPSI